MITVCKSHVLKEFETCTQKRCDVCKLEKAYNILMDYFDQLSDESKIEIDKRLNEVGY